MDKYYILGIIESLLESHNYNINNKKEINYGVQFEISQGEQRGVYRIYEGKKGIRLDSSQIHDQGFKISVDNIIKISNIYEHINPDEDKISHTGLSKPIIGELNTIKDPKKLIGVDESGKGDYFGPLVIAGVYTDEKTGQILKDSGVVDSKSINDYKIEQLANLIKNICPYDIVVIENQKYNELYSSIKNLNKLLAWGHARVIENLLNIVKDCKHALSDQFGKPELIREALMDKGKQIMLKQRPKAEENIAVAAASILARNEFVAEINNLGSIYKFDFPKGASSQVVNAAHRFVKDFGIGPMQKVAKLHFKITDQIL